ncbi:MAG: NADH-quinone oxidoreductase subunit M [Dehalococcoidia bacterium]|nr:NADH-quinone oxidoreductase subunit M [Dehalococcoidia bacterium]
MPACPFTRCGAWQGGHPLLSLLLFLPIAGAIACLVLPRSQEGKARVVATVFTLANLAIALALFASFDQGDNALQFAERRTWIDAADAGFNVQYFIGVDGLSATLVLLTGLLFLVAALISWNITLRPREYFAWLLALETAVMGVFAAQDLILFFLFWELELVPMFFLISIWGTGRKEYSAMKFVLYTLFGSALMLVGFLVLGFSQGTFDMVELAEADITSAAMSLNAVFFLILAAFAIKLPVFPLHTWLPDAHTDAPTAVSVILAGVLLKMGGYGLIRILVGILPDQFETFDVYLAALAAFSVLYGAVLTVRQTDLKRLIAYSSVSHMGYVLLGVAALGDVALTGAALQMFTHGTITALLFVMVGLVYDRTHTRQISDLSGLAHIMPIAATVFVIAGLASLGLPTMSGFVAELLIFLGSFDHFEIQTGLAVFGILLSAGYILWTVQRVFFGPRPQRWEHLTDTTNWWEQVAMAGLVAMIIGVGVYPATIVDVLESGIIRTLGFDQ